MNKGVEMIIARMESTPEEFIAQEEYSIPPSKWHNILMQVKERMYAINGDDAAEPHYKYQLAFLSNEEILAIWAKYQSLLADQFTRRVMGNLLAEPAREDEVVDRGTSRYSQGFTTMAGNYHRNQDGDQSRIAKLQQAYLQNQMEMQRINQTNILESLRKVEGLRREK